MKFVPLNIFKPSNDIFTERSKSVLFCGSFLIYVSRLSLLLLMHFYEINIRICQPSKVMFNLANPKIVMFTEARSRGTSRSRFDLS